MSRTLESPAQVTQTGVAGLIQRALAIEIDGSFAVMGYLAYRVQDERRR